MKLELKVELPLLNQALRRIAEETGKSNKQIVMKAGKIVTEKAMRLTPPGGGGMNWQQAKSRGNAAIAIDLFGGDRGGFTLGNNKKNRRMGIFFAVKKSILLRFKDNLGNRVKIKQREGTNSQVLFRKKDGEVYATQQHNYHPDASIAQMEAHHRRYFKKGRMTSSISGRATTGQWVFVESFVTTKEKLEEFLKHLQQRVGIWAAGFMPAAQYFKVKAPKWISKHAGYAKGRCKPIDSNDEFEIEIANSSGYRNLNHILPYALSGTRGAMIEEMEKAKAAALKKAGLKNTK